jgi:hypothetical protein
MNDDRNHSVWRAALGRGTGVLTHAARLFLLGKCCSSMKSQFSMLNVYKNPFHRRDRRAREEILDFNDVWTFSAVGGLSIETRGFRPP